MREPLLAVEDAGEGLFKVEQESDRTHEKKG
jgi:hypothetical protein